MVFKYSRDFMRLQIGPCNVLNLGLTFALTSLGYYSALPLKPGKLLGR
jgi:hypothetical protein